MARSKKYQDFLVEKLKDHDFAAAYLNEAMEESLKGDAESKYLFLLALKNVAEAQGGLGKLAKKAKVGRESLYKTLSEKGNPTWQTLLTVLTALGVNLKLA